MTTSVAKIILRLWDASKMMTGARKITKLKALHAITNKYGGTAPAVKRAVNTINKAAGRKRYEKTKLIIRNDMAKK